MIRNWLRQDKRRPTRRPGRKALWWPQRPPQRPARWRPSWRNGEASNREARLPRKGRDAVGARFRMLLRRRGRGVRKAYASVEKLCLSFQRDFPSQSGRRAPFSLNLFESKGSRTLPQFVVRLVCRDVATKRARGQTYHFLVGFLAGSSSLVRNPRVGSGLLVATEP